MFPLFIPTGMSDRGRRCTQQISGGIKIRLLFVFGLAFVATSWHAPAQGSHYLPLQFGAPITGRPYSATRILDYEPAPNSPDPVPFHAEEKISRDSAGRTRSEIRYPNRPATVDIIDFVSHIHYHWTAGGSIATSSTYAAAPPPSQEPGQLNEDAPLIEGIPTRYHHSVSGKDQAGKSIDSWYAPDLRLSLLTVIDEPGVGKTTYRFVNVVQAEPDVALFRVPAELTVEDANAMRHSSEASAKNGAAPGTATKPSLPHAITDDNYLEALARFHAAVPRKPSLGSNYHEHIDVRIIDIYGKESVATADLWQNGNWERREEHAPGFDYVVVWDAEQHWLTHNGTPSLRLSDVADLSPRPGPAERRIRIYAKGYVAMRSRSVDGVFRSCSGVYAGAEVCFDTSTGFPVSATVDDEKVVYKQWAQFGGASYPTQIALYRGSRLQLEATTTVTPLGNVGKDFFAPLPGITPVPNHVPAWRDDQHRMLSEGEMRTSAYGEALVKVWVSKSGKVENVELVDADDKSLGSAAIAAARETVYMPEEVDGHNVPFVTTFWAEHWSTPDPWKISATSLRSLGTD